MKSKLLLAAGLSLGMTFAVLTPSMVQAKATTSMKVTVTSTAVKIKVSKATSSGTLYAFDANKYASKDSLKGIGSKGTGTKIGTIKKGQTKTFTTARTTSSGYDNLYKKYYLMSGSKIIKGPVYATSISSKSSKSFTQKNIKGLFVEDNANNLSTAKSLGVSSVSLNINLAGLIYKNASVAPGGSISFNSNGKTYYFNPSTVATYDNFVKKAYKNGMNVIGIANAFYTTNTNLYPTSLRYNSPKSKTTLGTNTSNATGRDYYIAMMEFLANRYSSPTHGYISTYVIGNEIDFTHYFYVTSSLNKYMEEYSRSLRLANLAVKKYGKNINVAVPFTHYWAKSSSQMFKECPTTSFAPKKMLDWLAKQTNARGAYDWAIAPHPYGVVNTKSNMTLGDSSIKKNGSKVLTSSYKTSPEITFTNLEVLDSYLGTSALKYNGKKRSVYLTESGASSSNMTSTNLKEQAATVAYAYYKAANLSCIKSFNYYRLKDNSAEAKSHLTCGLLTTSGKKKPAYTVYKNINKSKTAASAYLKYISFKKNGTTTTKNLKSWSSAMNIYTSKFKFSWKKIIK